MGAASWSDGGFRRRGHTRPGPVAYWSPREQRRVLLGYRFLVERALAEFGRGCYAGGILTLMALLARLERDEEGTDG